MVGFRGASAVAAFLIACLSCSDGNFQNGATYDFIVVGGGTAGCAVARRLAQGGRHTVLLIESGGYPTPNNSVPALVPQFMGNSNYFRFYQTVPQSNAALANNGVVGLATGKILGGGSGINVMFWNRGSPHDFNKWARITGDDGWSYANLLQYFRRSENYLGNNPSNQRGFNGPISISPPRFFPGMPEWLEGGRELGYPVEDPNGPQQISFAVIDFSARDGRRSSSFTGYIEPTLAPPSEQSPSPPFNSTTFLRRSTILTNAVVSRILFRKNRAVGVRFSTENGEGSFFARARKEVILSAGAIESPLLLMRSGIGPKAELRRANITVRRNLPVGRNLQDHPQLGCFFIVGNRSVVFNSERDLTPENWEYYQQTGNGPYSSFLGLSGIAFTISSVASQYERSLGWADTYVYSNSNESPGFVLARPTLDDLQEHETTVTMASVLGRPRGRGSLTLNPENVNGPPVIDFRYFEDPHDLQILVDAMKLLVELCQNTTTYQRIGCRLPTRPIDACSHLQYPSDLYWECFVRQGATTGYHPTGTCRMGSGPRDPLAVVDSRLRVIGVDRLRVVDGSIMPEITNANTQSPIFAIGEKGADMILQRWRS